MKQIETADKDIPSNTVSLSVVISGSGGICPAEDIKNTEQLEAFAQQLTESFGVKDRLLAANLLCQSVHGSKKIETADSEFANAVISAIQDINPKDGVEALLAVQMVAIHNQCMALLTDAGKHLLLDVKQQCLHLAVKLSRTYTAQMEALRKHRQKGSQKMTVEHVHIHEGGQAIVGNVTGKGGGPDA